MDHAKQVRAALLQTAAHIRDTAMRAGPEALDDADRQGIFVLADLVQIRASYRTDLRSALECALDGAIGLLDAADAPSEDLENGHDAELDYEGEATLGAPEQHHNQTKWGRGQVDADGELELSLGAPEHHPWLPRPSGAYFGTGRYHVARNTEESQVNWAAGTRKPDRDEGEAEPGYDLPEGDEEWDGEGEDKEPSLGAANNHHNQTDWAQGSAFDVELVNEDGIARCGDGLEWRDIEANRKVARELEKQALAIRRGIQRPAGGTFDLDEVQPDNLRLIGGVLAHVVGVAG